VRTVGPEKERGRNGEVGMVGGKKVGTGTSPANLNLNPGGGRVKKGGRDHFQNQRKLGSSQGEDKAQHSDVLYYSRN